VKYPSIHLGTIVVADPRISMEEVWKLATFLWDPMPSVPAYGDSSSGMDSMFRKASEGAIISSFLRNLLRRMPIDMPSLLPPIEEAAFAHSVLIVSNKHVRYYSKAATTD